MSSSWLWFRIALLVGWLFTLESTSQAQSIFVFQNASNAWGITSANNWGQGVGVKPGSNSLTTNNDIAQISNSNTLDLRISFASSGNGVGTPYYLGAIDYSPASGTNTWTFGSNSNTAGLLNLNTATVNSQSNVYLYSRSASTSTWNIVPNVTGTGAMSLGLRASAGRIIVDPNNTINITSTITGTGGFVKEGAGELILGNLNNTYQGKTLVTAGVLTIGAEGSLGANPGSLTADLLTLNGGTLRASTAVDFTGSNRGVTLGASGGTFDTNGQGISINNLVTGAGSLTKVGTSNLTLKAANTYLGNTNVQNGSLTLYSFTSSADNRLPTSTVLTLGSGSNSGVLVLGNDSFDTTVAANQTVAGLTTSGSGLANAIVADTTAFATFTVNNSADFAFNGRIGGAGLRQNNINLVKSGAGKLALGGSNSYTGTTLVNGGTLLVDGTHTGGGLYTVNNNATLGGSGIINANANIGATGNLAPGDSPGRLTINGNVTFSATSSFVVEINGGTTAGTDYDQLRVGATGSLNLNGASLIASLGFSPSSSTKIFLTDDLFSGSITGTFNGMAEGSTITIGSYTATISYLGNFPALSTTGGNDIVLFNFLVSIPEPSTYALLGVLGVWGLQWYARRKIALVTITDKCVCELAESESDQRLA